MASIVVVTRLTSGTEGNAILNELARIAEPRGATVERQSEDRLELYFSSLDHDAAKQTVEDILTPVNASWPIHVRVEQP